MRPKNKKDISDYTMEQIENSNAFVMKVRDNGSCIHSALMVRIDAFGMMDSSCGYFPDRIDAEQYCDYWSHVCKDYDMPYAMYVDGRMYKYGRLMEVVE